MASIDYSFIETFAVKFKDPDGWDAVGTPTGSADQFFAELGKLSKKIQEGKLTVSDVEAAKAVLNKFADGINRLNARIAGAASGNAEDAKFAKAFRSMAADVNLEGMRVAA